AQGGADALFDEGNRLMAQGQLVEACAAFEASNRIAPRSGVLLRLGECREQNLQLASAWAAYRSAAAMAGNIPERETAATPASGVEPRLSHLEVSVSKQSLIGGLDILCDGKRLVPRLWNRPLPLDGGDHVISARAPGRRDWQIALHIDRENA